LIDFILVTQQLQKQSLDNKIFAFQIAKLAHLSLGPSSRPESIVYMAAANV